MAHADKHTAHEHHIIPLKVLLSVLGALVFLTIITVLTAQVDLGVFNVPLALTIAGTKALLVVTFFMALKYDNKVNMLTLSVGTIFVVIFLVFTLFDTAFRGAFDDMEPRTIQDIEREEELLRSRDPGDAGVQGATPSSIDAMGQDADAGAPGTQPGDPGAGPVPDEE